MANPGAHQVQHLPSRGQPLSVKISQGGDKAVVDVRYEPGVGVEVSVRVGVELRSAFVAEDEPFDALG